MLIDFWLRNEVSTSSSFFDDLNDLFGSFSSTFLYLIYLNLGLTIIRACFYCACALFSGNRLFNRLNKCLIFSKMQFFDKNPIGRIINRLSDDILAVDDYLPWSCHVLLENIAYGIGYPIGIIISFPWVAIFVIIAMVLIYLLQGLFRASNREVKRLNSVNTGKVLSIISEVCSGLIVVRAFQSE